MAFIDQMKKEVSQIDPHDFENYLIKGEIEYTKHRIELAMREGQNSVGWIYEIPSYETYTRDNCKQFSSFRDAVEYVKSHLYTFSGNEKADTLDASFYSLDDFYCIYTDCGEYPEEYRKKLEDLDMDYLKLHVEKGMHDLGCSGVYVDIRRETKTETNIYRKGLFSKKVIESKLVYYIWKVAIGW